jgi:hypothetical protein
MRDRSKWHPNVTEKAILAASVRRRGLDDPGFCLACGLEHGGCEPDAREYECEGCGENEVYGDEELLFTIADEEAATAMTNSARRKRLAQKDRG